MVDMAVRLAGVRLKNPILTASGTFGFGREYSHYMDVSKLGGICVKGLTLKPRSGNPPSRVAETPGGMLNAVGLENPGAEAFLKHELPFLRTLGTCVVANISGNSAEEFAELAAMLSADGVDILEVNVSCPNLQAGGVQFGVDANMAAAAVRAVRKVTRKPVMPKLTPAASDIAAVAMACADAGADAISLINTVPGMRIDTATGRPVLHNNVGGLSGPAVLPVAVRAVYLVRRALPDMPILGTGGVSSGKDAAELMLAGADAVAVGTAMFKDPTAPMRILEELAFYCEGRGTRAVRALTNAVKPW
jgi:dihydroorotate dehydrogenase (NAD+) catalytic subunit